MGAGKRLNGRGKKLGEEKSRKKVENSQAILKYSEDVKAIVRTKLNDIPPKGIPAVK